MLYDVECSMLTNISLFASSSQIIIPVYLIKMATIYSWDASKYNFRIYVENVSNKNLIWFNS